MPARLGGSRFVRRLLSWSERTVTAVKVCVIGAGAMGCIIGALLHESGHEVTLVDVWKEHVESINREGLRLTGVGGDRIVWVEARENVDRLPIQDLVLIMVKSPYTLQAVRSALPIIGQDTMVLTLQNGLGNGDIIASVVGPQSVIVGVTSHGGTVLGPGAVRHAGAGETVIAEYSGKMSERVGKLAEALTSAGIETRAAHNVEELIWGKLLVNVGINALTAILSVRNGELSALEPGRELVAMAVSEAVEVARAKGITLEGDPLERCLTVAQSTAENISSMLQDVIARRPTEVDVINGAIVREGERLGIPTPVNRALLKMIKVIELTYARRLR